MQRDESRGRVARAAALAIVAGAALRSLLVLRDHALLGPDSYPLVRAAGSSLGSFLRGLAQPLMDSDLDPIYYRPVLHASFALDRALFGLEPFGYHATSVLAFAAGGLALFHVARRLGVGDAGALTALLLFLLHPAQLAVVPAPARRADMLCLVFTLLAIAAQASAARRERRMPIAPALLAALAIGSKETGFVAPVLCGITALLYVPAPLWRSRLVATARSLAPLAIVAIAFLAWRVRVLGGVVGDRLLREDGFLSGAGSMLLDVAVQTASARGVVPDASFPAAAIATALGATVVVVAMRGDGRPPWRAALVGAAIPALLAALYSVGLILQPWYLVLPVAGLCLVAGALVASLGRALVEGSNPLRACALVGLGAVAALGVDLARDSLLVGHHRDWERASRSMDRYLTTVGTAIETARPGQRIALAPPPIFVRGKAGAPRLRGVVVLSPYTVEAWADLTYPDRRVRVAAAGTDGGEAAADEILLVLGRSHATPRAKVGPPARRPNVVILVADDLGYADLGFHGSTEIATPHLDRLAGESIRFTDAYVSAPLCAPARAGLLTGRDGNRFGYTNTTGTFQHQMQRDVGVPRGEVLLSEVLRRGGYATAAVGKWHLGVRPHYRPLARGFERYFGILAGAHDYFDWGPGIFGPVWRGDAPAQGETYLTDAFAAEAADFVRTREDPTQPFFLYVAFNAIHGPLAAPEHALERYADLSPRSRQLVAAMTTLLDDGVGRILDALRETGAERDTLVVFLNDNGGLVPISDNGPLRGGKGSLWEGGIRVPLLLRWPARLAPAVYGEPVSALDLFPTVVSATRGSSPGEHALDGVDLLPHLEGHDPSPPHESLYWRIGDQQAIRRGSWKLVRASTQAGGAPSSYALYDLATDVGESRDLATARPALTRSLRTALETWTATLGPADPSWRVPPAPRPRQGM